MMKNSGKIYGILLLAFALCALSACSESQQAAEDFGAQQAEQIKTLKQQAASEMEAGNRRTEQAVSDIAQ